MRSDRIEDGAKFGGFFEIGEGRSILGDLSVNRGDTLLYLHDAKFFFIEDAQLECILGTLHDRSKVSLYACYAISELGSATHHGEHFNFAEVIPAYIVSGNRHLDSSIGPSITSLTFHVDDAEDIFYDFDVMGHIIDPKPLIDDLVAHNARRIGREIPTGPSPEIVFFTGRTDLLEAETELGTVHVYHRPSFPNPLSSPRYVKIQNFTYVELRFPEPLNLSDAVDRFYSLLRFLELLAGRPQNVDYVGLSTAGGDERSQPLDMYITDPPTRPKTWENRRPHPTEILLSVVKEPEIFAKVIRNWIAAGTDRREARARLANCLELQNHFTIDRLVGAANMFDILPPKSFPPANVLSSEVADAKKKARETFRALPDSPERSSILSSLGRLGTLTLREKVRHRAALVAEKLGRELPHLDEVVDEAVKCRNYYVHGSPGSFSYADNGDMTVFLTRALEFLFAASDLIDAGWDPKVWRSRGGVGSHPFSILLHIWEQSASRLVKLRTGQPTLPFADLAQ